MYQAEKECIRFKIVPNLSVFITRDVHIEYFGDLPILSLRSEPLDDVGNRVKKRMLDIAVSLTRANPGESNSKHTEQRLVVMGDGDFVSNTYLGNGDNLNLGLNIVNWLSHDDQLIAIRARTAPDTTLNLSFTASLLIGFGFLFVLPLALLIAGLTIWLKRRKR